MDKKIVIFGATGTIGAYLSLFLKSKGYNVIAVGLRKNDNGFFESYGIEYISLDICKNENFNKLPASGVFAILHFAGILPSYNDYTEGDYINSIINGTYNVLEYAKRIKVNRIIFPQSLFDVNYLFGTKIPISPDADRKIPTGDHDMYVLAKNTAVELIEYYYRHYGIKRFIFRLSRIYAYHPNPFVLVDGVKKMQSDRYLIYRAIRGLDIEMWGDPTQILETMSIGNFQNLVLCALRANTDGGIYNVGSGGSYLKERLEGIISVFSQPGHQSKIIPCQEKYKTTQFVLDIRKTCIELGYVPQETWVDYLEGFKAEMNQQRFAKLWGYESDYITNQEIDELCK